MRNTGLVIGDVVVLVDDRPWSQCLNVVNGTRARLKDHAGKIQTFKVLSLNCVIPVGQYPYSNKANTLIQAEVSGALFAINACNLHKDQKIGLQYIVNGQNITTELSDQSKDAVLRAHLRSING